MNVKCWAQKSHPKACDLSFCLQSYLSCWKWRKRWKSRQRESEVEKLLLENNKPKRVKFWIDGDPRSKKLSFPWGPLFWVRSRSRNAQNYLRQHQWLIREGASETGAREAITWAAWLSWTLWYFIRFVPIPIDAGFTRRLLDYYRNRKKGYSQKRL